MRCATTIGRPLTACGSTTAVVAAGLLMLSELDEEQRIEQIKIMVRGIAPIYSAMWCASYDVVRRGGCSS